MTVQTRDAECWYEMVQGAFVSVAGRAVLIALSHAH